MSRQGDSPGTCWTRWVWVWPTVWGGAPDPHPRPSSSPQWGGGHPGVRGEADSQGHGGPGDWGEAHGPRHHRAAAGEWRPSSPPPGLPVTPPSCQRPRPFVLAPPSSSQGPGISLTSAAREPSWHRLPLTGRHGLCGLRSEAAGGEVPAGDAGLSAGNQIKGAWTRLAMWRLHSPHRSPGAREWRALRNDCALKAWARNVWCGLTLRVKSEWNANAQM